MAKRGELLRALSASFPAPVELERSLDSLYKQPDRVAAIMAAALIEAVLERLIRVSFKHDSKVRNSILFGANGPLSTFSGKIHIAAAFGIITEAMAEELVRMKNIRNVFAHAATNVDFETPEIAQEAYGFNTLEAVRNVPSMKDAPHYNSFAGKHGYILVAGILAITMDTKIRDAGGEPVYPRADLDKTVAS